MDLCVWHGNNKHQICDDDFSWEETEGNWVWEVIHRASELYLQCFLSFKKADRSSSLVVQWLGLCAFTAKGWDSFPGQGTKIVQVTWCGKKKPQNLTEYVVSV